MNKLSIAFCCTILTMVGCEVSKVTMETPSTPDGAAKRVISALTNSQPELIWQSLPASYQKDINSLIASFAENMDSKVYDSVIRVETKLGKLLAEKTDYIFGHNMAPMLLSNMKTEDGSDPTDELKTGLIALGVALKDIGASDLKSLSSLKALDVDKFLSTTGSKVLGALSKASQGQSTPGLSLDDLKKMAFKVLKEEGKTATLQSTDSTGKKQEIKMVKIEDRWLPKDLADAWSKNMTELKEKVSEKFDAAAAMKATAMIAGLESALDSLLGAKNQQEFNAASGALMGMAGSLFGG